MQKLYLDDSSVVRFRPNKVVQYLLDNGGLDMNDLARASAANGFSKADQEQFAQLIGYSVSGFGELSYVRRKMVRKADERALMLMWIESRKR